MFDAAPSPWPESKLELVPPDGMIQALAECGPMLSKAADRSKGRWDLGAIVDAIARGEMALWVSRRDGKIEGCATTQILRYPRAKEMAIPFVGGSMMRNWLKFEDELAKAAKAQGCVRLIGYDCRGGAWLRILTGWFKGHLEIVRPL